MGDKTRRERAGMRRGFSAKGFKADQRAGAAGGYLGSSRDSNAKWTLDASYPQGRTTGLPVPGHVTESELMPDKLLTVNRKTV